MQRDYSQVSNFSAIIIELEKANHFSVQDFKLKHLRKTAIQSQARPIQQREGIHHFPSDRVSSQTAIFFRIFFLQCPHGNFMSLNRNFMGAPTLGGFMKRLDNVCLE